MLREKPIWSPA